MSVPRISLRSLLIGINLVVLLLPLAGIQLMRLYESSLVRQTESALIAQGAFVSAFYRATLREQRGNNPVSAAAGPNLTAGGWSPLSPVLDLAASTILPPFPDGVRGEAADVEAWRVGRRLISVLKDAQLVTLAGIRVVDRNGVIVASTGDDSGQSIAAGEEVQLALRGEMVSRLRYKTESVAGAPLDSISRTSRVRVFVSSPIRVDGVLVGAVMLSRTPPSIVQALYAKRWLLLQALLLLLGLVVIMSLLTHRLIARPISQLAEHASAIASGQEHAVRTQPAQRARTLEVARLQEALENMAVTLQERANYLVDFARHVSHEFKTPLAGISGSVELLKDHGDDMDSATRERFLGNIADAANRLRRLTQRLLELTRAELNAATRKTFRLDDVLSALIEGDQSVDVEVSSQAADSLISGNPDALLAVLEILAENATQHGATRLSIDAQRLDESVLISVSDDGEGVSAGNRQRVFEPFFTTRRDQGGTGLGLSIAVALLKPTGGTLNLAASEQAGTCFVIRVCCG